jgi:hypothetical protein
VLDLNLCSQKIGFPSGAFLTFGSVASFNQKFKSLKASVLLKKCREETRAGTFLFS